MKILTNSLLIVSLFVAATLAVGQSSANSSAPYTLVDLGPVGGAPGQPITIAGNGLVSGGAATTDGSMHASLWYAGQKIDLTSHGLGGPNSMAFGVNTRMQAAGEAQTAQTDPYGEDFCGFHALGLPGSGTCLPFLWQNGSMTALPTLGGNNGAVNQVNSAGQAAGVAETSVVDPSCPPPQVLQFRPVIWQNGAAQELPSVANDPDGLAMAINENGQAVGGSGVCGYFNPSTYINLQSLHAVLWDHGVATDLGSLGGSGHGFGILALNVNNAGQVVGTSDLPGDMAFHGFLWTRAAGMIDLGTLPGDVYSSAIGINDRGQIVGVSLDANYNIRPFIRRAGPLVDLNTVIPANSSLYLLLACSINNRGEIIGLAVDVNTGEAHGYMLIPNAH